MKKQKQNVVFLPGVVGRLFFIMTVLALKNSEKSFNETSVSCKSVQRNGKKREKNSPKLKKKEEKKRNEMLMESDIRAGCFETEIRTRCFETLAVLLLKILKISQGKRKKDIPSNQIKKNSPEKGKLSLKKKKKTKKTQEWGLSRKSYWPRRASNPWNLLARLIFHSPRKKTRYAVGS